MATKPASGYSFPNVLAPFGPVPTSLTPVSTAEVKMLCGFFSNPTAADITITLTDTAGQQIFPAISVPAGGTMPLSTDQTSFTGVKWQAGAAGLLGGLTGYPQ